MPMPDHAKDTWSGIQYSAFVSLVSLSGRLFDFLNHRLTLTLEAIV